MPPPTPPLRMLYYLETYSNQHPMMGTVLPHFVTQAQCVPNSTYIAFFKTRGAPPPKKEPKKRAIKGYNSINTLVDNQRHTIVC